MLFPDTVRFLVSEGDLASVNVYLYTAQYTKELEAIIPLLDGITYTLHATANLREINDFVKLQTFLVGRKGNATFCNSHRLLIDPRVAKSVHIEPEVWDNVELAVWKSECDINPGEDFVRLSSPLDFSIKTHSNTKVQQRVGKLTLRRVNKNENE